VLPYFWRTKKRKRRTSRRTRKRTGRTLLEKKAYNFIDLINLFLLTFGKLVNSYTNYNQ
jgi:hypothetical protein